ncbi:unnamed protein product, partial [Ectocarpus fasciculatus]
VASHQGTPAFDERLLSKGRLLGQDRLQECFLEVTAHSSPCLRHPQGVLKPRHHPISLPICGREGQPYRKETLLEDVHFDVSDLGPIRRRHEVMAEWL